MVLRKESDLENIGILVLGTLLVVPIVTVSWIIHNVMIYNRLGPRKGVRSIPLSYEIDYHNRRVEADWSSLRCESSVTISIDEKRKLYLPSKNVRAVSMASHGSDEELARE